MRCGTDRGVASVLGRVICCLPNHAAAFAEGRLSEVPGLTDAAFWSSAAAGSALAGVMLELTSYGWLALVATGLAL
ncbi:MAG: hypothetical protein ACR2I5_11305, partial [Candidatus Limnocylindria bacterium]